ncbi:Carbamoyl-phosphate synthase large chain [Seminavis robusta]|uniref:Carbamoyl phosphate synthase arginine-specific large chain n=1 Tax=Seminavis robusta TaxID=568900 RepID=A0A9N8DQ26_9STRA|nr:Carbamoyl-phosphate synthase large chain [Seminavis robusta]|eukprot:Sro290_g109280.1 Carbamoyl-phosphate synthase large chain (1522) ;mRNA; r:23364-28412
MSTSMLRPIFSVAGRNGSQTTRRAGLSASRSFATQSGDDAAPPTALAKLHLEDGTTLTAKSFGCHESVEGEVVFATGMVGYPENLTDPSYQGQILTVTTPMVGNYGVPSRTEMDEFGLPANFESHKIHATGILVQDYSHHYSHWKATSSLGDWLKEEGVPGLCEVDTRMLTKKIREKGAMLGRIEVDLNAPPPDFSKMQDPNARHLVGEVSLKEPKVYGKGNKHKVIAVDMGMKYNIIRQLVRRDVELTVVPWDYPFAAEMHKYDGLFLSNGPGDPNMCTATVEELKKVVSCPDEEVKPIYGICMGNQLIGLAAGGTAEKLPFGNRGQNQPVLNHQTGECYITPQNHGFHINTETMRDEWKTLFTNANDGSNEGIAHQTRPYFTAQFHPEANSGPTDTEFMFDVFLEACGKPLDKIIFPTRKPAPPKPNVKKVLMLGSGGTSIGQAGEFDYSGGQAIKALKEEGMEVVLMNPNIASVQTNMDNKSAAKADHVFFLPVTPDFVEEVIKKEKPDGIVISMGGQTALNCAVEMFENGIFEKYGVEVLGTPVPVVIDTEDRQLFSDRLNEINEKIAESYTAVTVDEAIGHAKKIGYPLMIRSAFALGGLGSGICHDEDHLRDMANKALSTSPQILVERSMKGWKEVEYEVVRDTMDNCVTVCNMENFDPLGIHTGDSIVMAPSQTLSNEEYHMLRETALRVVRHLGIVGECNIQYALHPESLEYCIIEVNPRLSRSSALASKATGYPLAFVAAKLCLGIPLTEVINSVTKKTQACFEPSLDYVVTKIPRWDMSKFEGVSTEIGSAMKSVGEVMSIGRTIEETLQKAMRMVDPAVPGFEPKHVYETMEDLKKELAIPTDKRLFAIAQALHEKTLSVSDIHEITKIDHWFLRRLENIVKTWNKMELVTLDEMSSDLMLEAKKNGYSDIQISHAVKGGSDEDTVRQKRIGMGIEPHTKQIDTLAAEYPADTNYLYMTYHGSESDVDSADGGVIVLGSGAYRIGSSIEFDWCGVSAIRSLRQMGYKSTMINYNPETVSTDYDECDRLYFEELSRERVLDIYNRDKSDGVVVSVGGQIPNGLALPLDAAGVKLLGTPAAMIDNAEDRFKFSDTMDEIGVQQPRWRELSSVDNALDFAKDVGYPVLVRPSYVLSGAAMNVAWSDEQLRACLTEAAEVSADKPVVISDFIEGAVEIEFDGVGKNGEIIAAAIHEHIENAGVHSGDATLVLPAQDLSAYQKFRVRDAAKKIVKRLNITGPVNIQFVAKGTDVMCIECNVRASRSFPFVSKTMGVDYIEAATRAMVDEDTSDMNLPTLENCDGPSQYVGVKAPMFSFTRLRGSDPVLGVEMASTGEVACFGANKEEAFLKSLMSTGFKLPKKNILVSVQDTLQSEFTHSAWELHEMGYTLYATRNTAEVLEKNRVPCKVVAYPTEGDSTSEPNVIDMIKNDEFGLVINIPTHKSKRLEDNYQMRRSAVDYGVPLLTNMNLVKCFSDAMYKYKKEGMVALEPKTLFEHYKKESDADAWTDPTEFH